MAVGSGGELLHNADVAQAYDNKHEVSALRQSADLPITSVGGWWSKRCHGEQE